MVKGMMVGGWLLMCGAGDGVLMCGADVWY